MRFSLIILFAVSASAQTVGFRSVPFVAGLGAAAVAGAPSAPTPDVLWWKLNEGSGTSITGDGSAGGDDGTTSADWVTGKSGSGYALQYNGSSDSSSTTSTLTYGTNIVTICFWLNPSVTNAGVVLESSANINSELNGVFLLYFDTDGLNAVLKTASGTYREEVATAPTTNAWTHVAFVVDIGAPNCTLYYGGAERSTTTQQAGTSDGPLTQKTLYVGARGGTSLRFTGSMDDLRVYTGALTTNQITSVLNDPQ